MTIKEVEQKTGLSRSNIRFYEKEKLLNPVRNERNGHREYSEEDVENVKKIAYLRTLGISVEDIRKIVNKEVDLKKVIRKQEAVLGQQLSELTTAKALCRRMLEADEKVSYETLDTQRYVEDLNDYWSENRNLLKLDAVGFFYRWGGNVTWIVLTIVSLLVAVIAFHHLPAQIPVQWSAGEATSFADRRFIFAFPVACLLIRVALRPFIWRWLKVHGVDSDSLSDYVANYLCFLALSVEVFLILYVNEIMKQVTIVLFADSVVLAGILFMAVRNGRKRN